MLATKCSPSIVPATATFPVTNQEIKNVELLPVRRQVTVLANDLLAASFITEFRRQLYGYMHTVRQFAMRLIHAVFLLGYDQRSSC